MLYNEVAGIVITGGEDGALSTRRCRPWRPNMARNLVYYAQLLKEHPLQIRAPMTGVAR